MIPEKLGKYQIRGTLGRGAMGQVYDGWDPLIHRQVAIKTIRLADAGDEEAAEGLARFRREAQAAGRLSHPNIVGVYDFGETEEVAYIVMEFVAGGSLKDVLDRREPLAPAWVGGIMAQVLAGLGYSHARGVVHRDIKPANVMLDADGTAKLADFGIARIESGNATSVGAIMGTPSTMAPEQFLGEETDSRCDIYAAGAMLFHLLTGSRPYEGNPSAIMHKVLNAPFPPKPSERLAGLPEALDLVIARAMARRKEDRFQDAAAFSAALSAALSGQTPDLEEERTVVMRAPLPRPAFLQPAPVRAARKNGLWLAGSGAVLLAAGVAALLLAIPARRAPAPPRLEARSPAPAPLPLATPAEQAALLDRRIEAIPCSLARAGALPAGIAIAGAVGEGAAEAAPRTGASGNAQPLWQAGRVPASACAALAAAHEAAAFGLVTIGLRMAHIARSKGEIHLYPSIAGIAFPAYLRVDYLSADGTLFHVYPHAKQAGSNDAEDPATVLPPGETLRLGTEPHLPLQILPPFDRDVIMAVASNHPLLPGRRPNTEPAAPYLAELHDAIGQAKLAGASLAAGAASLGAVGQ